MLIRLMKDVDDPKGACDDIEVNRTEQKMSYVGLSICVWFQA